MIRIKSLGLAVILVLVTGSALRADPLKAIAKHLARGLSKSENKKIAVLPFPYHDGGISSGCSIVSERLINLFAGLPGIQVIERSLLSQVLGEMKLERSGVTDAASAQKLGQVLNVGAVVTGTLIDLENDKTEVNARLIKTETGEVLAADTQRIERTWKDLPRPPVNAPSEAANPVNVLPGGPHAPAGKEDVLTLTNKDLEAAPPATEPPDGLLVGIMKGTVAPPPQPFALLRRIYQRNPNPHNRALALFDIAALLERTGRPQMAANTYRRLLQEFPGQPRLCEAADARLHALGF